MLSGAKHLQCLLENKQMQILRCLENRGAGILPARGSGTLPRPRASRPRHIILQPLHFTLAAGMCIMPTSGKAKKENLLCNYGNPLNAAIGVNSCNS